jgi:hypothetical protein
MDELDSPPAAKGAPVLILFLSLAQDVIVGVGDILEVVDIVAHILQKADEHVGSATRRVQNGSCPTA